MNLDDIKEILELVREHELEEFELERDGLKVRVRKAGSGHVVVSPPMNPLAMAHAMAVPASVAPGPAAAPGSPAGAAPVPIEAEGVELAVIKSPIVGTVYLAPEPGAKPFVQVGDTVKKGQVLCIIEAMKLMNEIECDCDGEVATVYVQNSQAVQFGDRLFAVKVS
jgi:acetyl-CoA carboxylase biotin carboxyl carrier protein